MLLILENVHYGGDIAPRVYRRRNPVKKSRARLDEIRFVVQPGDGHQQQIFFAIFVRLIARTTFHALRSKLQIET